MTQSNTEIISFHGGDGSTIANAVQIVGAQSFFSGIQAEIEFIMNICGKDNVESVAGRTIIFPNAVIHHVNVVGKNGEIKNIFFDASGFQAHIENEDIENVKVFATIN